MVHRETSPGTAGTGEEELRSAFRRGLVTNLLNPKAGIFYVAMVSTFITANDHVVAQTLFLSAVFVAIATGIHLAIVLLASRRHGTLADPRGGAWSGDCWCWCWPASRSGSRSRQRGRTRKRRSARRRPAGGQSWLSAVYLRPLPSWRNPGTVGLSGTFWRPAHRNRCEDASEGCRSMSFRRSNCAWAAALVVAALTLPDAPATAQGLFDFFHNGGGAHRGGGWFGQQRRQYAPQQASPYADPGQYGNDRYGTEPYRASAPSSSGGGGRSVAYCVRLCDGRYFPIQRHANASSAQLCNAFCPAAKTQVFNGSQIDHAAASNGARYADLDNAFVYRQKVVPDCSCNGKDSFGLARIDVASDPTLRAGDIVASGDNVKAALIAMHAAKERGREREAAAAERAAPRDAGRRTATTAPVPPPSAVPAEPTDDMPED